MSICFLSTPLIANANRPFDLIKSNNISPILVELFTSQGCSSCPPADELLMQLAEEHPKNIIALSYHVDYWNRLGWVDPHSKPAFTSRQRNYAHHMNERGVYTPQMVINGNTHVVGSSKNQVTYAINAALESNKTIPLTSSQMSNSTHYQITVNQANLPKVETALVELISFSSQKVRNYVPAGENKGSTLEHTNVVQHIHELGYWPNNKESMVVSAEKNSKNVILIRNKQGHILGMTRLN